MDGKKQISCEKYCRFCEFVKLAESIVKTFVILSRRRRISFLSLRADSQNLRGNDEYYNFTFDSQSIRNANRNRSNGGVAFVFVEIFELSTRLESVEVQKFSQVRKMHPSAN